MGTVSYRPRKADRTAIDEFRRVIDAIKGLSDDLSVVLVTNIKPEDRIEIEDIGIDNTVQHYTERQASSIIQTFQSAGFHVVSYFSEDAFMADVISEAFKEKTRSVPVVFSAAEGGSGPGRRALIPAFCQMHAIAYCNSSPHGCSVARHKYHAHAILRSAGLPAPKAWMVRQDGRWIGEQSPPPGERVIVKPMYESMALGIDDDSVQIVAEDFQAFAQSRIARFAQPLVVQQFVTGHEVAVPILDLERPRALPVVAFTYEAGRYGGRARTFEDENRSDRVGNVLFDALGAEQNERVRRTGELAFEALDMSGMGRIDMRIDEDGRPWIFDTNEAPPPLPKTSYAMAMDALGFTVEDMLALWTATGLRRAGVNFGL